jgi:hypothetical protein
MDVPWGVKQGDQRGGRWSAGIKPGSQLILRKQQEIARLWRQRSRHLSEYEQILT